MACGASSKAGGLTPSTLASLLPPPLWGRAGEGGGPGTGRGLRAASRFATSSLVPRVDARARCAAASPPARRSQELSGGGCNPVPEPRPASPRLIAGLSSSASAGPIGCTSGRWALDFGVFDFLGTSGVFAMTAIWDCGRPLKRPKSATRFAVPRQIRWLPRCCQPLTIAAVISPDRGTAKRLESPRGVLSVKTARDCIGAA